MIQWYLFWYTECKGGEYSCVDEAEFYFAGKGCMSLNKDFLYAVKCSGSTMVQ